MRTPQLPYAWLPQAKVERIVVHWTAGGHTASLFDRAFYHLLIEADGSVKRGLIPIGQAPWPSHTRGLNTHSVGIALCAMGNAVEWPFHAGGCPVTVAQAEALPQVSAQVLKAYGLPVTPRTQLCHAEVTDTYGILQHGKWDIGWIPGIPLPGGRPNAALIGHWVREKTQAHLGPSQRFAIGMGKEP